MRRANPLLIPLATSVLLGLSACGESRDPVSPSFVPGGSCSVQVTYSGTKVLTVPHNTTNNVAGWFIKNTGTSAITLNSETRTKSGNVTATRYSAWVIYPHTLAAGTQIDADLFYDVGAAGSGTVGMKVFASCGTITLPNHLINIT